MSICLLAILLLSNSVGANSLPNSQRIQGAYRRVSVIQAATDSHKGKVIGVIEYDGFRRPTAAATYLEEQNINLMGAKYDPELAEAARKALLKWLKENGRPNARVDVSVRPLPDHEDEKVIVAFTAAN